MAFGVSSSCFYPLETEKSLAALGEIGVEVCELFFNSPSETDKTFLSTLREISRSAGITVRSVHPWSSFAESHMLFSEYERRFFDTLEDYRRYFFAAKELGADFVVIHGSRKPSRVSESEYFDRFHRLVTVGRQYGIRVIQENVNAFLSESPSLLARMKNQLGDGFEMAFDIKQAVRAGYDPIAFAREFASSIVHVHVSDHLPGHDCLAPGRGKFNFRAFFDVMEQSGYSGDYIVELYLQNFGEACELAAAVDYMKAL